MYNELIRRFRKPQKRKRKSFGKDVDDRENDSDESFCDDVIVEPKRKRKKVTPVSDMVLPKIFYRCGDSTCMAKMKNKECVYKHCRKVHNGGENLEHKCIRCGRGFASKASIRNHYAKSVECTTSSKRTNIHSKRKIPLWNRWKFSMVGNAIEVKLTDEVEGSYPMSSRFTTQLRAFLKKENLDFTRKKVDDSIRNDDIKISIRNDDISFSYEHEDLLAFFHFILSDSLEELKLQKLHTKPILPPKVSTPPTPENSDLDLSLDIHYINFFK